MGTTGTTVEIDASSTNATSGVDVESNDVQLNTIQVTGGQEEAIHIGPHSNIKLIAVGADSIAVDGSRRVTVQQSVFSGCGYYSDAGGAAALLVNIPLGAKITFESSVAACFDQVGGAGMIVQDSGEGARHLGRGGILVRLAGSDSWIDGGSAEDSSKQFRRHSL